MFPIRDINPTRIFPVATLALIAANVAIFFLWQPAIDDEEASERFLYERAAIACEVRSGDPLTLTEINEEVCSIEGGGGPVPFPGKNVYLAVLVSMFLHGGLFHLLGNMWFLWIFGNNVEEAFGTVGYLLMYLVAGIVATLAFVVANANSTSPVVGASGAIAGVLGAYLVLFPNHRVLTWIIVFFVPIPALVFLGLWLISQFVFVGESVAWEAHVGGFIFGVLVTLPLRERLLRKVRALHATVRYR